MEVRILGPLEVVQTGTAVVLGGGKQRAVFAMLALRVNRLVSMDYLVDGLWGTASPTDPVNVVQVYLSRLRKALHPAGTRDTDDGRVIRRKPGYLLQLDPEHLDLHRFQRLTREGSQLLPSSPEAAAAALTAALGLWRGVPLAEFTEEPFARDEITRLQELRLTALTARIRADLAVGRHAGLIGELEDLTSRYPLHEGLRGQLMLSLYRSGRQAEALEAYRRARDVFADELGIDPGRDLQDLEAAVLAHHPDLDWTPPPTTSVSTAPVAGDPRAGTAHSADHPGNAAEQPLRVWNVPARNPHFTGRGALLDQLHQQLRADPTTLAVQALYGLGGVGKTQVAVEYAHRYASDYDLVWWVDAEQAALIPGQLAVLADRLGLPNRGAAAGAVERLVAELTGRSRWLLIFDNAEHPDDIAGYRSAGSGHMLVTSRYPGWGELGGRIEVDVLDRAETSALLRSRILQMTAEEAEKLAAELGDLPLAAAQAAAYLEQTGSPASDYLHRFRDQRSVLLARGDVLGYQGRIDTAWVLALDRLRADSPAAVQLLEYAAFLAPEPIPVSLLTAHSDLLEPPLQDPDTIADAVGAAVRYSLIRRSGDVVQVHRLVQAVIRNRLAEDRREAVLARVIALLAAACPAESADPSQWPVYGRLAPHLLAAGAFADRKPEGRRLLLATVAYLGNRGDTRASRRVGEELERRWRRQLGEDHPDTLAAAAALTAAWTWLGDTKQACALGEDALRKSRRVLGPDHPVTLRLATNLTPALTWQGRSGQACALGEDTLRRSRMVLGWAAPDTLRQACNLVLALAREGRGEEVRTISEDTLQRCRESLGADHPLTVFCVAGMAMAAAWLGNFEAISALGADSLQQCRDALSPDNPHTLGLAACLTFTLGLRDQTQQARALGEDTLQRSMQALGPDHVVTLGSGAILAFTLAADGKTEQARNLADATLQRIRTVLGPDNLLTLICAAALTTALAELGQTARARAVGEDTLRRARAALGSDHPITLTLAQIIVTSPEAV